MMNKALIVLLIQYHFSKKGKKHTNINIDKASSTELKELISKYDIDIKQNYIEFKKREKEKEEVRDIMMDERYYQQNACDAILNSENPNNIVKMFCGSGKTHVMVQSYLKMNDNYACFVFPSIALITQFNNDYGEYFEKYSIMNICSKDETGKTCTKFTTEPENIRKFLIENKTKLIFVTYHSFPNFIESCDDVYPNIGFYDEAHHIFRENVKEHISSNIIKKQFFFTATPKDCETDSICDNEPIVNYSHRDGVRDNYLNDFEVYVDLSSDIDLYPKISRAILKTKNNRVMTFHSDVVNSVSKFVNEKKFKKTFETVCLGEFPELAGFYKKIRMVGVHADTKNRQKVLREFDSTPDDEIYILASCRTIGEGIDTKNANMCVFADVKKSYVAIVQNIGRIVRKQEHISTVLLPINADKTKYQEAETDEERDLLLRQDMSKEGDFQMILNVLSALRADDPEIFDLCLKYPNKFSPNEMEKNFEKQGAKVDESSISKEEFEIFVEKHHDTKFEVHTHDMENPIEEYNTENDTSKTLTFYKDEENNFKEVKTKKKISPPKRKPLIKFHDSDDFKVLWGLTDETMLSDKLCGAIESKMSGEELERIALKKAQEVVDFWKENDRFPSAHYKRDQDEQKIGKYFSTCKQAKKNGKGLNYPAVDKLFTTFFGDDWHNNHERVALDKAKSVIDFYNEHKRLPLQNTEDPYEKKLHGIYNGFLESFRGTGNGIPYQSIDELFTNTDDFGKDWWKDSREQDAIDKAHLIVEYYNNNDNTIPSQYDKDDTTRSIGNFYTSYQVKKRNKSISPGYESVYNIFANAFGNNWWKEVDLTEKAKAKANEIIEYFKKYHNVPSQQTDLGSAFGRFKCAKRETTKSVNYPEVDELFTKTFGEGWEKVDLYKFYNCVNDVQEVIDFHNKNKKFPSHRTTLGTKLQRLRQSKNGIDSGTECNSVANEMLQKAFGENWWEENGHNIKLNNRAKQIVEFYNNNNKFPSCKSKDKTENSLGCCFISLKKKKKENTEGVSSKIKQIFTEAFGEDWENMSNKNLPKQKKEKCPHKWKTLSEDGEIRHKECELCGRKGSESRTASDGKYHEPNPEKKNEINTWLSGTTFNSGKAIVLDASDMKTTHSLKFSPEQIIVPEYDTDTFEENSKNQTFGKCLRNGDFLEILKKENPEDLSLIYADFTGTFQKWVEPLFEYLGSIKINSGTILGITWSVNGHKKEMSTNLKNIGKFCGRYDWEEIEESPSEEGYGAGANMFVQFLRKN